MTTKPDVTRHHWSDAYRAVTVVWIPDGWLVRYEYRNTSAASLHQIIVPDEDHICAPDSFR